MYGCFLVPPDDDGARLGVLFWHKDGFSTACGHGTIALGAWAVESGPRRGRRRRRDRRADRRARPGAWSRACAARAARSQDVTFRNVPSYVLARDVRGGRRRVRAPRGSTSPTAARSTRRVPAARRRPRRRARRAYGRADRARAGGQGRARRHRARPPPERRPAVGRSTGRSVYDDLGDTADGPRQRNVTVFADGEVDRSPCGSGTCARAALLHADGRLGPARTLTPRLDRRHDVRRARSRDAVARRGPRRGRRRGRAAPPTAPASTASCSTPATRSGPASCCGERVAGSRSSTPPRSRGALAARRRSTRSRRRCAAASTPTPTRRARPSRAEAGEVLIMPSASPGAVGVKLVTVAPGEPGPRAAADPGRLRAVRPRDARARPRCSTASR